jgi:hypothetical protein
MAHEILHGSCSCGRNEYTIQIPNDVADHARIYFDTGRDSRECIVETLVRSTALTRSYRPIPLILAAGPFRVVSITHSLILPG